MDGGRMRQTLRAAGAVLSVAGMVFVLLRIRDYGLQGALSGIDARGLLALGVLGAAYAAANVPLAAAWRRLLKHCGSARPLAWAVATYGKSQLAKYVPGNIFHLAGRQAIAMSDGVPGGQVARSAIWELGTIAVAALPFAALLLPLLIESADTAASLGMFGAALGVLVLAAYRQLSADVAAAVAWYALFFLASAILFCMVLAIVAVTPARAVPVAVAGGAYVLAWLAGLVTPGAPAGLGVREFVLYAALHTYVGQAELLAAIVVSRGVTASGDLLFYLVAVMLHRRGRP